MIIIINILLNNQFIIDYEKMKLINQPFGIPINYYIFSIHHPTTKKDHT